MVPSNLIEYHDQLLLPGDYHLVQDGAIMCCPGCAMVSGPRGKWTYDATTRSLTPSVVHDATLGGCGWHGYLTNGEWVGCGEADLALERRPLVQLIVLARTRASAKRKGAKIFRSLVTGHYQLFCPGCRVYHAVAVGRLVNGDLARPTFSDSLGWTGPVEENGPAKFCHSYVEEGRIRFLDDSWHELRGQTVELPDVC